MEDNRLLERIRKVHAANHYAYGYRRTWKALLRAGEVCGRDHVKRLMHAHGIQGARRRGEPWKTTRPDPEAGRRPDLVQRDFTAADSDELWVADLTHLRCWEGLVFFAFVLDAHSRRVVGWQLASHMRTTLVLDALRMALRQSGADVELGHHSDRVDPSPRTRPRRRSPLHLSPHRELYLRNNLEPKASGDPPLQASEVWWSTFLFAGGAPVAEGTTQGRAAVPPLRPDPSWTLRWLLT